MRDTAKVRVERVESTLAEMAETLKQGRHNHIAQHLQQARRAAELATAPVFAPPHGAEYARALIFFADTLGNGDGSKLVQAMGEQLDSEGVIWRPTDQVRAAHKQIGRLRSDVLKNDPEARSIPLTTLVYAGHPDDFIGATYERCERPSLPIKASYEDPIRVRIGNRTISVPVAALRYVEGAMIRPR